MLDFPVGVVFFYPNIGRNLALPEKDRCKVFYETVSDNDMRDLSVFGSMGESDTAERNLFIAKVKRIENLSIGGKPVKTAAEFYDHKHKPLVLMNQIKNAVQGLIQHDGQEELEKN